MSHFNLEVHQHCLLFHSAGVRILTFCHMLHFSFCFFPPQKCLTRQRAYKSRPTEGACVFNVQLSIAGKSAELFPNEFRTGVNSNSCKPIALRFMVIEVSFIRKYRSVLQIYIAFMGVLVLYTYKALTVSWISIDCHLGNTINIWKALWCFNKSYLERAERGFLLFMLLLLKGLLTCHLENGRPVTNSVPFLPPIRGCGYLSSALWGSACCFQHILKSPSGQLSW